MPNLKEQIKALQKENRWIDIVQLVDPYLLPEEPGWKDRELVRAAGFAHSQLRHFPEAEKLYRRWLELEPDSAAARYSLGYLEYLQNHFPEALKWYDEALEKFPDYLVCLYRKGVILVHQEKSHPALDTLLRVREIYEKSHDANFRKRNFKTYIKSLFQLGKAYHQLHLYEKAIDVFKQFLQMDKRDFVENLFKYYNLGKNYLELHRLDEAVHFLNRALEENNHKEFVWERLGRVYHVKKDYGEALKHFARALDCRRVPYIFVSRAETYLAMGEIEKAKRDFHIALKRDRKSRHKIYLTLGTIALQRKHFEEAESYYQQAIDFKKKTYTSDFAEAHYALSQLWMLRNRKDKAKAELEKAMAINPYLEWDNALLQALDVSLPDSVAQPAEFYL